MKTYQPLVSPEFPNDGSGFDDLEVTQKKVNNNFEYVLSGKIPVSNVNIITTEITDILPILLIKSNTGDVNCTKIKEGENGQKMEIWGTSNTDLLTITSLTQNVKLQGGVSFTLGLGDCIVFRYLTIGANSNWYEISRSNNE